MRLIGPENQELFRDDAGFTLAESIFAAFALFVISVSVLFVVSSSSAWYGSARTRTAASSIANDVLTKILARNVGLIYVDPAKTVADFPGSIPPILTFASDQGTVTATIGISVLPTDTVTNQPVKKVTVTATCASSTVTATGYSSGWPVLHSPGTAFESTYTIQVKVKLVGSGSVAGTPVQLRSAGDFRTVAYQAPAGQDGYADLQVLEGDYFLTVPPDWSGQSAVYFPRLIHVWNQGSDKNPILAMYHLFLYAGSSAQAHPVIKVGVFSSDGLPVGSPVDGGSDISLHGPLTGAKVSIEPVYPAAGVALYPPSGTFLQSKYVGADGTVSFTLPYTTESGGGTSYRVWTQTTTGVYETSFAYDGMNPSAATGGGDYRWWGVVGSTVNPNASPNIQFKYVTGTPVSY